MNSPFKLLLWQKRQAALIYHFTSMDYLKEIQRRFNALLGETESVVDTATTQGRDRYLQSKQWGQRDTVDNWANSGAWGAMKDTQKWLAKLVALRATETYSGSGMNSLAHMLDEFSTLWMTPDEEEVFKKEFEALYDFAEPMDEIAADQRIDYWDYSDWWKVHHTLFPRLSKFRVRTDVEGESGKVPPRTGVYVAQDDPNAGLQFGWTGAQDGYYTPLPDAQTFNEMGLHALQYVGRDDLWFNEAKMDAFCMLPQYRDILTYGVPPEPNRIKIASKGTTERPCKWYFVEMIHGEFDDEEAAAVSETSQTLRALPGEQVPQAGLWYTPAIRGAGGTLTLAHGAKLPDTKYTDYGEVVWYWQPERQPA